VNSSKIEKARELFQQGVQVDPTNAYIFRAWAIMEKEQGDIEKALELFQQGTEANPTNVSILHDWAIMEKDQGKIEKARELFQKRVNSSSKAIKSTQEIFKYGRLGQ